MVVLRNALPHQAPQKRARAWSAWRWQPRWATVRFSATTETRFISVGRCEAASARCIPIDTDTTCANILNRMLVYEFPSFCLSVDRRKWRRRCDDRKNSGMPEVGFLASDAEDRTHFSAWCLVSSPLILGHNIRDQTQTSKIWPIITNEQAISVKQKFAGHPGGLVASWNLHPDADAYSPTGLRCICNFLGKS